MTDYSFDAVAGQTLAFDVDADALNIAYGADQVSLDDSSGNLVVTVANIGTVTLTGVTIGQLVGSAAAGDDINISVASGTLLVGDNTSDDATDTLPNVIAGGTGNDLLYGMGGGDTLTSNNGDDVIFGGSGLTDTTDGGDTINTGTGSTTAYGNAGDDTFNLGIIATGETQNLNLGLGNDTVNTAAIVGDAVITGNAGDDTINVSTATATSNLTIYGGNGVTDSTDGADIITTGLGNSTVYANAGADTVTFSAAGANTTHFVNAGLGNDTVDGDTADFAGTATIAGGYGDDDIDVDSTAVTSLTVYGGNGLTDANTLEGADNIEVIDGGALATAAIYGNGGNDTIVFTGAGDDAGAATINGGLGDDTVTVTLTNTDTATIALGAGDDTVNLVTAAVDDGSFTLTGFDTSDTVSINFNGSAAADATFARGSSNVVLDDAGNEGAVIFDGFTGDFAAGDVTFTGGGQLVTNTSASAVAATLAGSDAGADQLVSGDTSDTFSFTDATSDLGTADVVTGGAGTDTIAFSEADTGIADVDFTNVTGVEAVTLADGANTFAIGAQVDEAGVITIDGSASSGILTLSDSAGHDNNLVVIDGGADANIDLEQATGDLSITGGAGADDIVAGAGNDTLLGGEGAETNITGGAGTDSIDGGAGADTITGGTDADTLTGGTGADDFNFAAGDNDATVAGVDVITDFDANSDTIGTGFVATEAQDLTGNDYDTGNATLIAAIADAVATDTAFDGTGEDAFIFTYGGKTYLTQDLDADGAFAQANDIVIDITGYTGTFDTADVIV